MKKRHRRRIRWNNVILLLLSILFLIGFIISANNIIKWLVDSKNTNDQIDEIINNTNIIEIKDNENTEIVVEEENIDASDPYWDYIKIPLIDVNFDDLKNQNDSTIGWIQVNGTNINYPFVQTTDNDYYLSHSFNKKYNSAGWVFMDYRNNKYDFDKNTILYAHGRLDNTMFGSLKKIITNGWLDNTDNHIIKLSTELENTLWQVFSVYKIPTTSDYLKISFDSNDDFLEFANTLKSRSIYNFNTSMNENDKILTLSSCYDDTDKVVLHAKLIKREKR